MRKIRTLLFATVGGLIATTSNAYAACGTVTITEMNWSSAAIVTEVSKFLLEQGYGCEVTKVPSSTVPAITSIAETGSPDIATEIWVNNVPLYRKLETEEKIITVANVLSDGGIDAWWIPRYLAEEHPELTKIDGILKNPELVGGVFHNCPDGWGCRKVNDNLKIAFQMEANGLKVFDHGSGETLATSIAAAYEDRKPWFGYYWAPTSVLGKYPMVKVDLGPYSKETHDCNLNDDCATPGKSTYPVAEVLTGLTKAFAEREPEAVALMRNVSFTNDQMSTILAWQEDNNASAEEAAVRFLTEYSDSWVAWLSADAREKLKYLLP